MSTAAWDAVVGERPVNMLARTTWAERTELARVVVAGGKAQVWAADGRTVVLRSETEVASVERRGRDVVVTTAAGETWTLHPAGCGCGSPLKSFKPPTP